jgi:hypothetical protein
MSVYVSAATFVVCLVVAIWNTLRWSNEAEVFESELREADKIKKRGLAPLMDRTLSQQSGR